MSTCSFTPLYELECHSSQQQLLQVAQHSLLFRWEGGNAALNPVLFVSHMDVVPATEGDHSGWNRNPFGGEIADKWAAVIC